MIIVFMKLPTLLVVSVKFTSTNRSAPLAQRTTKVHVLEREELTEADTEGLHAFLLELLPLLRMWQPPMMPMPMPMMLMIRVTSRRVS